MSASLTDNQILKTIWDVLDRKPNDIFGCPAISLDVLYSALNTTPQSLEPNTIISILQPNVAELLGTKHKISLKSVRKGDIKQYWIVFEPLSQSSENSIKSKSSWEDLGEDNVKNIELLPDLPGGETSSGRKGHGRRIKSARNRVFGVLGLKKDKSKAEPVQDEDLSRVQFDEGLVQKEQNSKSNSVGAKIDGPAHRASQEEYDGSSDKPEEEKDWLEQAQKWHKHKDENQPVKTKSKPERKGTEWDIIDAYDYGSEGEDSSSEGTDDSPVQVPGDGKVKDASSKPETEDAENEDIPKVELKSEFDPEILDKRSNVKRKETLFVDEDFNGTVEGYYDKFDNSSEKVLDHEGEDGKETIGIEDGMKNVGEAKSDKSGDELDGEARNSKKDKEKSRKHRHEKSEEVVEESKHKHPHKHKHRSSDSEERKHKHKHKHRSSSETSGEESKDKHKERKHRHKHKHEEHKRGHKTKREDSNDEGKVKEDDLPTPFLIKSFKGLPFEPDTQIIDTIYWVGNRWQLILAELIAVLGTVYIIQASGLRI